MLFKGELNQKGKLDWKQKLCKYFFICVLHFGCSVNTYMKEVLLKKYIFNSSGYSHVGLLFADEEQ